MTRRLRIAALLAGSLLCGEALLQAHPSAPLPDDVLDGGIPSAETLGRGGTIASNVAGPASGSENPAALSDTVEQFTYATALVDTKSSLPDETANATDALGGKVLRYISLQGEKGVIYYEPLSRLHETQVIDPANPTTDFRNVDYSANAIGFAGASRWGKGGIGLSFAYLWSSIGVDEHRSGQPNQATFDTSEGFRMNVGVRYPTGPAMWGILVQNAPGFLWGKEYRREQLPFKVRVGNTVRMAPGYLLSVDWERRFYGEGSHPDNYVYIGNESKLGPMLTARIGAFGTDVTKPETRHWTAGLTLSAKSGAQITYAADVFEELKEKVTRHVVSLAAPFEMSDEETRR